jgi:hypothetical protein
MDENVMFWGKIGWLASMAIIGVGIWYFRVRRKRPPQSN